MIFIKEWWKRVIKTMASIKDIKIKKINLSVNVRISKTFKIRLKLGMLFLKIAAFIINFKMDIKENKCKACESDLFYNYHMEDGESFCNDCWLDHIRKYRIKNKRPKTKRPKTSLSRKVL